MRLHSLVVEHGEIYRHRRRAGSLWVGVRVVGGGVLLHGGPVERDVALDLARGASLGMSGERRRAWWEEGREGQGVRGAARTSALAPDS